VTRFSAELYLTEKVAALKISLAARKCSATREYSMGAEMEDMVVRRIGVINDSRRAKNNMSCPRTSAVFLSSDQPHPCKVLSSLSSTSTTSLNPVLAVSPTAIPSEFDKKQNTRPESVFFQIGRRKGFGEVSK
jgi:hypothetical protein